MLPEVLNIYNEVPASLKEEYFEKIVDKDSLIIERIISEGHVTPEGTWYDQETNEFVILLKGFAELEFEDGNIISMNQGDYIVIPAHAKHRVIKTAADQKTFWLAVHYL